MCRTRRALWCQPNRRQGFRQDAPPVTSRRVANSSAGRVRRCAHLVMVPRGFSAQCGSASGTSQRPAPELPFPSQFRAAQTGKLRSALSPGLAAGPSSCPEPKKTCRRLLPASGGWRGGGEGGKPRVRTSFPEFCISKGKLACCFTLRTSLFELAQTSAIPAVHAVGNQRQILRTAGWGGTGPARGGCLCREGRGRGCPEGKSFGGE